MSLARWRRLLGLAGAGGCLALAVPAALTAPAAGRTRARSTGPVLGLARLQGQFTLTGRVTVATRIRGERVGQRVVRTWTFIPGCPTGVCGRIGLVRRRSGGVDRLALHYSAPGHYIGWGSFYAPLRCRGRRYRRGELAKFSITVTVTQAAPDPTGQLVVTELKATYRNRSRRNLTPCVDFPGYDAASYQGQLASPSPTSGGAARRAALLLYP